MTKGPADAAPLVIVLSGPSGAGKDTLLRAALAADSRLSTVVTAKTRPPRSGEEHGVQHLFVSDADFDALIAAGELLEHAEMYGHRSGVPREQVRQRLAEGKTVVLRTDVQGARRLRERVPGAVLVFVTVPDRGTLERRLRGRASDSEADLQTRLAAASAEMEQAALFDHVIINREGREAEALAELLTIINEE
ncbi:MAG: guanylate kinase, partial [Dehalococcoidia bacterium]